MKIKYEAMREFTTATIDIDPMIGVYDTLEDANTAAEGDWEHLTAKERKECSVKVYEVHEDSLGDPEDWASATELYDVEGGFDSGKPDTYGIITYNDDGDQVNTVDFPAPKEWCDAAEAYAAAIAYAVDTLKAGDAEDIDVVGYEIRYTMDGKEMTDEIEVYNSCGDVL